MKRRKKKLNKIGQHHAHAHTQTPPPPHTQTTYIWETNALENNASNSLLF